MSDAAVMIPLAFHLCGTTGTPFAHAYTAAQLSSGVQKVRPWLPAGSDGDVQRATNSSILII